MDMNPVDTEIYIYPQNCNANIYMLRRLSRYVYLQCKLCGRFWLCAASRLQSRRLRGSARNLGCQVLALGWVQGASGFCPEVVFLTGTGSWDLQGRVLGVVMQGREQQTFSWVKERGEVPGTWAAKLLLWAVLASRGSN